MTAKPGPNSQIGGKVRLFEEWVDKVVDDVFSEDLPAVLHHYTSWDAFCGIVAQQRFWFTDHRDTNDKQELFSAQGAIDHVAEQLAAQANHVTQDLIREFRQKAQDASIGKLTPVYLACFSTQLDQPVLWERFAAAGVCMTIPILNDERIDDEYPGVARGFRRVLYDEAQWSQQLLNGASSIVNRFANQRALLRRDCQRHALSGMLRLAARAALAVKRGDYAVETEWRQIAFPGPRRDISEHVQRDPKGRRYLPLLLRQRGKRLAIDAVVVAPDSQHTVDDVVGLLRAAGYQEGEMPAVRLSAA